MSDERVAMLYEDKDDASPVAVGRVEVMTPSQEEEESRRMGGGKEEERMTACPSSTLPSLPPHPPLPLSHTFVTPPLPLPAVTLPTIAGADEGESKRREDLQQPEKSATSSSKRTGLLIMKVLVFLSSLAVVATVIVQAQSTDIDNSFAPTAPVSSGAPLSFSVIGDWGHNSGKRDRVAKVHNEASKTYNTSFILSLGDNFYDDGVTGVTDKQFQSKWANIYTDNKPWYVIAGNHDWHRDAQPEVDFSKQDSRWIMPAFYYDKIIERENISLHFVFIDTEILVKKKLGRGESEKHLAWIEKTLADSTADWLIVAGHYPIFSVGSHGPNTYLIDSVLPLLKKYKAAAYLSGHDHMSEYFLSDGVAHIVSGDGGRRDSLGDINKNNRRNPPPVWYNAKDVGGIAIVEVESVQSLSVSFLLADGKVAYKTSLSNGRKQATTRALRGN